MIMKKNILFLAMSAALLTSSCSDFLDVQPEGNATINAYFLNDQQAIDAVDGLYERFHQEALYGRELFWEQGAACDVVWGRTLSYTDLALFTNDASSSTPLNGIFETLYKVIARSNWVIKGLLNKEKKVALTPVETRSLGEAYFTRGWAHFLVAYRYGLPEQGVPFVRYEDFEGDYDYSIPPQQKSVQDNYRMIIEDMDWAIERLPRLEDYDAENVGRAHDAAAVAFKAKVYAYWATWELEKWKDVITMVNDLESTYHRNLAGSLDEVFSSDFADFYNEEYIWAIPGNGGSNGGGSEFPGVILENKGWGKYNGWGQNKPSYDIYEEMRKDGEGNARLVRSILEYNQEFQFFGETRRFYSSSDIEAGFMINKYMDPFKHKDPTAGYINSNGDWPTARINFPVIRFAEMLLFRAEAYLMTNQADKAWTDLNRIHKRACGRDLDSPAPATMAQLYHERRCELAFEFTDHLFDLKRWHRSSNAEIKALAQKELNATPRVRIYEERSNPESNYRIGTYAMFNEVSKATYEDYRMVFPYPYQQVVNSNGKLKQNPGYN